MSIRKADKVSITRVNVTNREHVNTFFKVLEKGMIDQNLLNKPANIYNINETGFQLKNEAEKIVV